MSSGVVVSMMYNIKIASDWPISMMDGIEPDHGVLCLRILSMAGLKLEPQGKKMAVVLPPNYTQVV